MDDPREKAKIYIETHKIKELFEEISCLLLYYRPMQPIEFLIQQLNLMKNAKENRTNNLFFNEMDIRTMFNMFDITNQGVLSLSQYDQALKNFGIDRPTIRLPESLTRIDRDTFIRYILQELKNNASMTT